MMTRERFEQLLLATIDSVEQSDMLVAMDKAGVRWWRPREVAAALGLAESTAHDELETLATRGLLDVRLANDVHYRVAPATPELRQFLSQLAGTYPTSRPEIRRLIRSRVRSS